MTTPLERATTTAAELVRYALVAKLAVNLGDPPLARRAARYAESSARLLGGLEFPVHVDDDDDLPLPEVDDLLARMPSRQELLDPTRDSLHPQAHRPADPTRPPGDTR